MTASGLRPDEAFLCCFYVRCYHSEQTLVQEAMIFLMCYIPRRTA